MNRKKHIDYLSIKELHLPYGGTLDPENRSVLLSELMPWEELEETYAPQFSPTVGAPARARASGVLSALLQAGSRTH